MIYPGLAHQARWDGVVVVKLNLDASGNVKSTELISGSEAFAKYALANAKEWKYQPTHRKTATLIYEFTLDDGVCFQDKTSFFTFRSPNIAFVIGCRLEPQP